MVVRVPRIVIIGGGTDGTLTATRLRRVYGDSAQITVADRDDRHVYQPGMLSVLFGRTDPGRLVRSRRAQLHDRVELRLATFYTLDGAALPGAVRSRAAMSVTAQ